MERKLKKGTTTRIVTFFVVVFVLVLAMAFVFFSRYSGSWFKQTETTSAIYDMGIVKIDGAENIQYNIKKLNFPASTLLRGTESDDENFNTCVFAAKMTVTNVSTVPITLGFSMENTIVSETDSKVARANPGLCYSLFYAKKGEFPDTIKLLEDMDYKGYFGDLSGFTQSGLDAPLPEGQSVASIQNTSLPPLLELDPPAADVPLVEYDVYWIFWVDHLLVEKTVPQVQSNTYTPLNDEYGVNISIAARQK